MGTSDILNGVHKTITIRHAQSEGDKMQALSFIDKHFTERNGCPPPKSEGDILIACEYGSIIGAVNLDFRLENTLFPLEEFYDFSYFKEYFPFFDRRKVVQGGRWSANKPEASRLLLSAIALYCMSLGIECMLGEAKHYSVKRLDELGIKFVILYGVCPSVDFISEEKRKYYMEHPSPRLMLIQMKYLL